MSGTIARMTDVEQSVKERPHDTTEDLDRLCRHLKLQLNFTITEYWESID